MESIIHIIISGKVQGVFFRATTKKIADNIGVKGWIRNVGKNQVEIVAQGHRHILQEFKAWCMIGPPLAKVERVDVFVSDTPDKRKFKDFLILHD